MTTPATLDQVLEVLRAKQPEARAVGIELVGVVGSLARGEAHPDSDVDVVYKLVGKTSLFEVGGILMDLCAALGRKVDLVDLSTVRPRTRAGMQRDLIIA